MRTKRLLTVAAVGALLCLHATPGQASVIFRFSEVAGTVVMTSSGTLDTVELALSALPAGWGGTGIEDNSDQPGDIDIMGGDWSGSIDTQYGFNLGTDVSAITNPGGPFTIDHFNPGTVTASTPFTTYGGFSGGIRQAGIGMRAADIIGGLWTPDQTWIYTAGTTLASLGLNLGTFTVSDILTGESITIQVGAASVPEPATLLLLGAGLGPAGLRRRLKNRT